MRFPYLTSLGAFSLTAALASACGGSGTHQSSSAGTGGAGGEATSSSSSSTSSSTSSSSSSGVVDAGPDVDNGMVSTTYPAFTPQAPQVQSQGGPVLAAPKFVPVFFANEDANMQSKLSDFVSKVGSSPYWTATTSEYGVSAATALSPVVLTETAPSTIDDSGIQTWLAGKLNADDPAWPAADPNTLYILHYPAGTGITLPSQMGDQYSCQTFGGYHSSTTLDANHGGVEVAYAVIPRCSQFDYLTGIDAVTGAESHELIEAVTDPFPQDNPAYALPDSAHLYWFLALGGGEIGDMCAQFPNVFTKFAGLNYTVQRTWSNAAAWAFTDPCVPSTPGEVYFNTAPVLTENVSIQGLGTMKGVKIPIGQSKTIELDLFSQGDTGGPWNVDVQDYLALLGQASTMDFSLDRTQGQNGEKLHLTITVNKAGQYGVGVFQITSSLGQTKTEWLGLVGE